MNTNEFLVQFIGEVNGRYQTALNGLTAEQLYHLPDDRSCHIAFHGWHFARTEDNIINFVCQDRKQPVWLRQSLDTKWNLPKAAQGTGMMLAEAQALRLPSGNALLGYLRDVWADIEPYLANASDNELQAATKVSGWGERPKLQHIGRTIIAHGNEHLGQIMMLRTLQGLPGDPF